MEIVLASHNAHKVAEFSQIIPEFITVKNLTEIGFVNEIPERGTTFHENAYLKAKTAYDFCQKPCFSDDSGLVVPALNGEPGIFSARYANTENSEDNLQKVLQKMENEMDRSAYFICVICFYDGKNAQYFEGKVHGTLLTQKEGTQGFGYDPIFVPNGYTQSFASISPEEKNTISHRAKAVEGFVSFLHKTFSR